MDTIHMSYEGMKKCQIVTLIIRVIDTESVSVTNDVRVIYWQDVLGTTLCELGTSTMYTMCAEHS